jgi:hypothetical protein
VTSGSGLVPLPDLTSGLASPPVTTAPRQGSRWATAVHLATLVAGFVVLLHANRDQWFFGDEWDFLADRGVPNGDYSLWAPHTEHWSTAPILIYRALYATAGLRSYVPYVVVLLVLHVAVTHFLWQIMRQAGVDPALATALAAVYAVLGAGHENLLWAFQIGFIGSVALGLAGVLLVNHDGRWNARDYVAWVVSVLGLTFSGVTVTMVAVAGLVVLMRRGLGQAALTVAVPGAVYLLWFVLAGNDNLASDRGTFDDVLTYSDYIWTGLWAAFEQSVGFPGAGALLALGLAAFLLRRGGRASGPEAPAFACALGTLVIFSIIAVARAGLGVQQAQASRYAYIVMALALPAIGLGLHELMAGGEKGHVGGRRAVVLVLLLLVGLHNGDLLRHHAREGRRLEQRLKAQILAAADLVSSGAVIFGGMVEPEYSPDLDVHDLRAMVRDDVLPKGTRITPFDRFAAADRLQYSTGPRPLADATAPRVDGVVGATEEPADPGCVRLSPTTPTPEIHVAAGAPMSLRFTTQEPGELTGYLRIFSPSTRTGTPHVDKVQAGVPVYVNVTAAVDQVAVRVPPAGTTEVCGLL